VFCRLKSIHARDIKEFALKNKILCIDKKTNKKSNKNKERVLNIEVITTQIFITLLPIKNRYAKKPMIKITKLLFDAVVQRGRSKQQAKKKLNTDFFSNILFRLITIKKASIIP
jgi:hypothetical protein